LPVKEILYKKTITSEILNFKRRFEALETLSKNFCQRFENLEFFEAQMNKLTKDFNVFQNSMQIVKNCELFSKEIAFLKEKTNNLAFQVNKSKISFVKKKM